MSTILKPLAYSPQKYVHPRFLNVGNAQLVLLKTVDVCAGGTYPWFPSSWLDNITFLFLLLDRPSMRTSCPTRAPSWRQSKKPTNSWSNAETNSARMTVPPYGTSPIRSRHATRRSMYNPTRGWARCALLVTTSGNWNRKLVPWKNGYAWLSRYE